MIRKVPKLVVVIVGLVLAAGVVGAAAAGSPPEAADDGLTTAEERTGFDVPTTKEDHPTKDDHPGGDAARVEAEAEGVGPVDNHGAEVSAVAQDDSTTGREHGEAVSAVARGEHGGDAAPNENAATQASLGAENAGEHGKP
jgi:hypothetical protein